MEPVFDEFMTHLYAEDPSEWGPDFICGRGLLKLGCIIGKGMVDAAVSLQSS
jgi:hypothetical protein